MLANGTNRLFLIISVSDFIVNGNGVQSLSLGAAVHQLRQVILAENTADFSLRCGSVIPEISFKAVCGKHHRAATEFPFQTIGIEHGLLSAYVGVF